MTALRITSAIRQEWQARGIADVIPALEHLDWDTQPRIQVDAETARRIADDCRFYLDPDGPDTALGERSAYRALLRQCEAAAQPETLL